MAVEIPRGSINRRLRVRLYDTSVSPMVPATGKAYTTLSQIWYQLEGGSKTTVTLSAGTGLTADHVDGAWNEVGDGWYQVDYPDATFAKKGNVLIGGNGTNLYVVAETVVVFQETITHPSNVNCWDWGNTHRYLTFAAIPTVRDSKDWSLVAWVRCDGDIFGAAYTGGPGNAPRGCIIEHSYNGTERIALRLATHSDGGKFSFAVYNGSTTTSLWTNNTRLFQDGKWHCVVGTNTNGTKKLYIDGYDLGVTAAVSAQPLAGAQGTLGYESGISWQADHHQTDTIIFNRVLTQDEARRLTQYGPMSDLRDYKDSILARWYPDFVNATTEIDKSGNGLHCTWNSYSRSVYKNIDITPSYLFGSSHAVGNSLTEDAKAKYLSHIGTVTINASQTCVYHAANPTTGDNQSVPWGTALADRAYDVLSLQPFPDSSSVQTVAAEVAAMQTIINSNPSGIVLVHEGWAPSAVVITGTEINAAYDGTLRYSTATFNEFVRQLQEANPDLTVVRSRTNEAIHLAYADILDASVDTGQIETLNTVTANTSLYRDGLHMHYLAGRYLAHHCLRRALGIKERHVGYPFLYNSLYSPSYTLTMETIDWLDSVVDRIFPETIQETKAEADAQHATTRAAVVSQPGNAIQLSVTNLPAVSISVTE